MELANKANAKHTLLIGDDELANGRYGLKNMQTGDQQSVAEADLATLLNA
jgi:histidyl-tRNA synthetase